MHIGRLGSKSNATIMKHTLCGRPHSLVLYVGLPNVVAVVVVSSWRSPKNIHIYEYYTEIFAS